MLRPFAFLALFLLLLITSTLSHYILYNEVVKTKKILSIVNLTKLSSPAFSSAFYEPRKLFSSDISNPAYPQMQTINKMDFIYDK